MPESPWWKRKNFLALAGLAGVVIIAAFALLAATSLQAMDIQNFPMLPAFDGTARADQGEKTTIQSTIQTELERIALVETSAIRPTSSPSAIQPLLSEVTLTITQTPVRIVEPSRTNTPTRTPLLTKTPSPTPVEGEWEPCPKTYRSRLHTEDQAYVSFDPPLANRVRVRPSANATIDGLIQPGDEVKILDGPVCANNWVWWKVSAQNKNLVGWTSEGDMENYWLVPLP